MATFGFDRLIYGYNRHKTTTSLGDPQDWVLLTNHDPAYIKMFLGEGMLQNAPMLKWALANDGACSWRWPHDMELSENLSAREQQVVDVRQHTVPPPAQELHRREHHLRHQPLPHLRPLPQLRKRPPLGLAA